MKSKKLLSVVTVSYTHLDVYKRQELPMKYITSSVIDLLKDDGKKTKEILSKYEQKLNFDQYIELLNDTNNTQVYNWED